MNHALPLLSVVALVSTSAGFAETVGSNSASEKLDFVPTWETPNRFFSTSSRSSLPTLDFATGQRIVEALKLPDDLSDAPLLFAPGGSIFAPRHWASVIRGSKYAIVSRSAVAGHGPSPIRLTERDRFEQLASILDHAIYMRTTVLAVTSGVQFHDDQGVTLNFEILSKDLVRFDGDTYFVGTQTVSEIRKLLYP